MDAIPIVILSFNRLTALREAIESYRQISTPTTLVIHDSGSTYQPLLDYLGEIEKEGGAVYYSRPPISCPEDLNSVADTIEHWYRHHDAPFYVVTDPDIVLEENCADILNVYFALLSSFADVEVVGPMLRIDNIPDSYPLKAKVIERHTAQFWRKTSLAAELEGREIRYQFAPIDTTFGMYRRGFRFHRLCQGIRTYPPYWARHLDWYIDPSAMSKDQQFYLSTASDVSHWGGLWLRDALQPGFEYEKYDFKV